MSTLVQNQIKRLRMKLNRLEAIVDVPLDAFILELLNKIKDHQDANIATQNYNLDWFLGLPFSDSGILSIAVSLISEVNRNKENHPYLKVPNLWLNISEEDPETIAILDGTGVDPDLEN